jgi:phage terminase large subunit-like protein
MLVASTPWTAYAAGSEIDHFAIFCGAHLVQSVDAWDGEPLNLEPWQDEMMGEALAYDGQGWPVWRSVVLILPRKNGKTTLLAGLAVYRLVTSEGSPEILLAASSDKQAGRLFDAAATFCRRDSMLDSLVRIRDYLGQIVREDGQGHILRMSSDPARLHGYNPSLVIVDELAQWTTPSLRRAYAALTSGGGARKAPQTFTITTAGEAKDREDSILGRILDTALQRGEVEGRPGLTIARFWDAKTLVYNFEAPTHDPRDVAAMKLANPASWITENYLAKQAENPELTDAEVLQLHGCVWAAGQTSWLPAGTWQACAAPRGEPPEGTEIVLGFDGSYNNDSTALVGCTLEEKPYLFVVGAWEKPERARDWLVPREEVKARVAEAFERWRVVEMACDPPGWHHEIDEWADWYGSPPVIEYVTTQRVRMSAACSKLYTAVVNRAVEHDGNRDLARHIANAVVKETPDGAYITKDGRNSPRKIDLAVAAVLAYDRASARRPAEPWFEVW